MKTTKINLPEEFLFLLAEDCAKKVYAVVISMHLRVTDGIWGPPMASASCGVWNAKKIQAVRKLVSGFKDEHERRSFVFTIRYLFKKMREENRTQPKWQDVLMSVRKAFRENQEAQQAARLERLGRSNLFNFRRGLGLRECWALQSGCAAASHRRLGCTSEPRGDGVCQHITGCRRARPVRAGSRALCPASLRSYAAAPYGGGVS